MKENDLEIKEISSVEQNKIKNSKQSQYIRFLPSILWNEEVYI
jgi:hypothetical protein